MNHKFALHNFAGQPRTYFLVEGEDVKPTGQPKQNPTHHIAVLDVSGSMWGDLDSVKSVIEKVFTAEEFNDPSQKVSFITYSSNGDCRVHFEKVTVGAVMAPNSPHLAEIRNLRTRGLTGISQALAKAESLVNDDEMTCISLHTDGYANDPSPFSEAQNILTHVQALEKHPNVFCNTVAYRNWCDFALLDAISNRLSGVCVRVSSARQVYDALHSSQSMLAGSMAPTIEAGIGNADFITFVSKSATKVLGGTSTLNVRGLAADDDATVYRYMEVDEATYHKSTYPVCGDNGSNNDPVLAYARAQVALGNLTSAKFALISTRSQALINGHIRAMVAAEVSKMGEAIEQHLFQPTTEVLTQDYGLDTSGPSVLSLVSHLNHYRSSLRVNVEDLGKSYKRRGLKKVAGKRDDDGNIVPPNAKLQTPRDQTAVQVTSIDINRDTATINIKLVQDGTLIDSDGNTVDEIAGIKLDLKDYRNYTLVGDGSVNTPVLPLRTSDKRCFAGLKNMGLVEGDFDPSKQYDLRIGEMPLVDYDQDFEEAQPELFNDIAKLTVLQKILSGLTKGESEALTGDQIAALKDYHITPALYFSPPSTTPYSDIKDALNKGEVDTRMSYKVKLGTPDIIHVGKLKSGNAYLQRRFTRTLADGTMDKKPTLDQWWADGSVWGVKSLSARTKLDAVDNLTYPIYEGFLGLGDASALNDVLEAAFIDTQKFDSALNGGMGRDEALDFFKECLRKTDSAVEALYQLHVCPLAFYVGATGLVPDTFTSTAMTADDLTKKFPQAKLGKAEKEGMYYEIADGLLLGVFLKGEHFSTDLGVKAAAALA